jgi:hypothetical protein
MKQVRFSTLQDLFGAYPSAGEDVGKGDPDMPSLDFLRQLADTKDWEPAISLCAYLLPRREAVAWGCRSLRRMADRFDESEDRAIAYAEEWAAEPEEWRRTRALALGNRNNPRSPTTWLALAAGWSGGSVMPPECEHREAPPEQTAKAVRVSLFVALSRLARDAKDRIMTPCLEDGIQSVRGEPGARR